MEETYLLNVEGVKKKILHGGQGELPKLQDGSKVNCWLFLQSPGRGSGSDIPAHYASQAQLQVWGRVRPLRTGVQEGLVWAQAAAFLTERAGSASPCTGPVTSPPPGTVRAQQSWWGR